MSVLARIAVLAAAVLVPLALAAAVRRDREMGARVGTLAVFFGGLWLISWAGAWAVAGFAAVLGGVGLVELSALPEGRRLRWAAPLVVGGALAAPLLPVAVVAAVVAALSVVAVAGLLLALRAEGPPGRGARAAAALHLAAGVAAMPLVEGRREVLFLGVVMLLQFNDGFAYLVGRLAGRTPLAPRVSPRKTVEGALGGAAGTLGLALVMRTGLLPVLDGLSWGATLALGLLVVVAGVGGDLLYSLLKRRAGLDDFSALLPGHGGVLDRADSGLAVFPLVAAWAVLAT